MPSLMGFCAFTTTSNARVTGSSRSGERRANATSATLEGSDYGIWYSMVKVGRLYEMAWSLLP